MPPATRLRVVSPPAIDQQHEEEVELHVGEALSVDFGMQQGCCDVVAGIGAFASREFRCVGEHLRCPPPWRAGCVADETAVHDLGQLVESVAVFQRNAEQFGDHVGRAAPRRRH